MRNAVAQPIIRTLLDHLAERRSFTTAPTEVPAADYTDEAHLAAEQATLFTALPQVVALSPDLPEPGSFVTRDQGRVPLLLTRDAEGEVHALANVCAHRGAQVAPDGRGCQRRFTCPYHAWTYDLTGRLAGRPDAGAFPAADGPLGLRPLPVREEHGVIWTVLDPAADPGQPLDPGLGHLADDLAAFDIPAHSHWRSHRFELDLNWKLVIDTFLEPYHFASLHRNTVGPLFVANLCHAERVGRHVREALPRRSIADLTDADPATWDLVPHSALVYVLFPNTVFVMQIDHLETWRVTPHPSDPGRSVCDLDFHIPAADLTPESAHHWERNWELTIDTVINEDFRAMAGVQRGLASGALDHLTIGANEPALGFFHAALADALAEGR